MDVVTLQHRPPPLTRPVLIAAFAGWNDAGEAATGAAEVLVREFGATAFADIDPEEFFDFQSSRPMVRLDDSGSRVIDWPRNRFSWARLPAANRDVVLLEGTEPNLRWRTFVDGILDLAESLGVDTVVTLGALQVDVPHTRPVPVTGSANDVAVATRLGLRPSRYEGPTGITGVLNDRASARGLVAMSMWAGVPHYLAGTAYLTGALAIAERVARLLDVDLPLGELAHEAVTQRDEIAELVAGDDDLAEYVHELEQRTDRDRGNDEVELSDSGVDALVDEVERFLRDRDH